jgi:hypothetical protein
MAKVLGIREVELNPGVSAEEFERFAVDAVARVPQGSGLRIYVVKGDRGDKAGTYLWITEIDSVEVRDRYWPAPDQPSEEGVKLSPPADVMEQWQRLVAPGTAGTYGFTDYVEVSG